MLSPILGLVTFDLILDAVPSFRYSLQVTGAPEDCTVQSPELPTVTVEGRSISALQSCWAGSVAPISVCRDSHRLQDKSLFLLF